MTDTAGAHRLDARTVIQRIESGEVPREFVLHAARGFLPIPQDDLVAVLARLARSSDEEISSLARASLAELPPSATIEFARSSNPGADHLDALAFAAEDPAVTEAILRNRETSDQTVERLARQVSPYLQEVIVINQERILRSPSILDSLLMNPRLSPDTRRRALEIREEFFIKRERVEQLRQEAAEVAPSDVPEEDEAPIADLLEKAEALELEGEVPSTLPSEGHSHEQLPAYNRILKMSVSQKVKLAFKGDKSERAILVRDRNKLICTAVLRNGRVTEQEVETFAAARNVEDEVLRLIAQNRQWMSKYAIVSSLVRNPKAPVGVVLPLINHLTLKDLQILSRDRNVSDVVRKSSWKLFQTRTKR